MPSQFLTSLLHRHLLTVTFILMTATATWGLTTSAVPDQTCGGYRATMNCSAGEFTITPQFSADTGTPPFCVAGQYFWFKVVVGLSGVNTKRYNIGFYAGQQGNDPTANTAGPLCSVATFPNPTPAQPPWTDLDNNACGDYESADKTTIFYTTVDKIKVLCNGDPTTGALLVPYAVSYQQSAGTPTSCTGPQDGPGAVKNESPSKCNKGTSNVSGSVQVYSAAYVDVTKVTVPAGDPQEFGFTATSASSGAKISALTNPTAWTPTPDDGSGPVGGTYTPDNYTATSGAVTIGPTTTPPTGVGHSQKVRFYLNAIPTGKTMTITEAAVPGWEPVANITCTNATPDNSNRTITASLGSGVTSAACTIVNTKKPRVRIQKTSNNGTGTFNFTLSDNMTATTDAITTGAAGTPAAGSAANFVNDRTQDVVITETAPADWPANPVAASCNDANYANSGNPAPPFGSLAGNVLTIPKGYLKSGADIVCAFTNTKPTVQVRKTSFNGTGSFAFAGTNGIAASFAIATDTAGVPKAGSVYTVASAASAVTVTETPAAGWPATPVSASCSDSNGAVSGNGATTFGSLSGAVLTIPAANLKPAAQIVCDLVNAMPTVQLRKTSTNGTGTFGFTMTNLANSSDSLTTTVTGTPVSGLTSIVTSAAASVTISETTLPAGWPANPTTATCSDSNGALSGNGAATFGSLTGNVLTIPTANLKPAAQIVCTVTNTYPGQPLLSVVKFASSGSAAPGQTVLYTIQVSNSGAGDGKDVELNDDLSPYTAFGIITFPSTGTPFNFTDSGSGLAFGTPEYYIPATGWSTTTPADDGSGFNNSVTKWRILMNGTIVPGGGFTLNYRTRVK